jgi:hypothetical protein
MGEIVGSTPSAWRLSIRVCANPGRELGFMRRHAGGFLRAPGARVPPRGKSRGYEAHLTHEVRIIPTMLNGCNRLHGRGSDAATQKVHCRCSGSVAPR